MTATNGASTRWRIGIDVGGTFTDFVASSGTDVVSRKVASSPPDFSVAILAALPEFLSELGASVDCVDEIVHGTTATENIVLECKGARTGLITNAAFEDVLEIGRYRHPHPYDLTWRRPKPLVDRHLRFGVAGRLDAAGNQVVPLSVADAERAAGELISLGVEAIAVSLLHAYRNPDHERQIRDAIRRVAPGVAVSIASDLSREYGEFERTSTAVIDAYVKPEMSEYVTGLERGLGTQGLKCPFRIVQASGALLTPAGALERPILTIGSGPAAGVAAAIKLSELTSMPRIVAFDMGGTTAKASAIVDGRVSRHSEHELGGESVGTLRLTRGGGGYLVRIPGIEIAEVGAGGGSIARIENGMLKVGPRSAGARPGPVCYGRGGTAATVTDANLVLGYLNADGLLGGDLPLDLEAARRAIAEQIAAPAGSTVEGAAFGVHDIANVQMVAAISSVTLQVGLDPSEFSLIAYGGSGPVHACHLAQAMGMPRVVVPANAGVFSSVGTLATRLEFHLVTTVLVGLEELGSDAFQKLLADAAEEGSGNLPTQDQPQGRKVVEHVLEMRYRGQTGVIEVPVEGTNLDLARIRARFESAHQTRYGFLSEGSDVELINVRTIVGVDAGDAAGPMPLAIGRRGRKTAPRQLRRAYFGPHFGWQEASVVGRDELAGRELAGPALVDDYDSTLVVPPRATVILDRWSNIVVELEGGS